MKEVHLFQWALLPLAMGLWVGCSESSAPEPSASPTTVETTGAASPAQPSDQALVVLAKADLADGEADKTISRCLTCSLGMSGDAQYAATFGDYTLHLCSAECKAHFEAEPEKAVLMAKLPSAVKAPTSAP